MQKIDKVVARETGFIAAWVLIFSLITQSVFLVIGKWDLTVLFGNILGGGIAILNFFLMGLTVQNAVAKSDEKDSKQLMKMSNMLRNLLVFVVALVGVLLPFFSTWTVIIPLFFTRIAILIRPLWDKDLKRDVKIENTENSIQAEEEASENGTENSDDADVEG